MSGKKILTIDDDRSITKLNETVLSKEGYEVTIAEDGYDGIRKAEEIQPDCILLDLILPGQFGYEVCKNLNENDKTKDIPVIIVTGSGLEEVAMNEPNINASGYLCKPYGAADLIDAVKKVLKDEDE